MQDPIQSLVQHPEHGRLYVDDPMAVPLSNLELKIMVDLIVENMPVAGYKALEV